MGALLPLIPLANFCFLAFKRAGIFVIEPRLASPEAGAFALDRARLAAPEALALTSPKVSFALPDATLTLLKALDLAPPRALASPEAMVVLQTHCSPQQLRT